MHRNRKLWHLLLRDFCPLLPRINFWKGDYWALRSVFSKFWHLSILRFGSATREATRIQCFFCTRCLEIRPIEFWNISWYFVHNCRLLFCPVLFFLLLKAVPYWRFFRYNANLKFPPDFFSSRLLENGTFFRENVSIRMRSLAQIFVKHNRTTREV